MGKKEKAMTSQTYVPVRGMGFSSTFEYKFQLIATVVDLQVAPTCINLGIGWEMRYKTIFYLFAMIKTCKLFCSLFPLFESQGVIHAGRGTRFCRNARDVL